MTSLGSSFEDELARSLLDQAEHELVGKQDNLVHQAIQFVRGRLERYGREHDYRVQPVLDSLEPVEVDRSDRSVTVRFGWSHEAFGYLEFGTSAHTIEGNPVLSFVWEQRHDPPEWVAEEFEKEGDGYRVFLPEVEVAGVRETRALRDAIHMVRRQLE